MGILEFFESVAWNISYGVESAVDTIKDTVEDVALNIECKAIDAQVTAKFIAEDTKTIAHDIVGLKQDLDDLAVSTLSKGHELECSSDIKNEADKIIENVNEQYQAQYNHIQTILLDLNQEWEKLHTEKTKIAQKLNYNYGDSIKIPTEISVHSLNTPIKKKEPFYVKLLNTLILSPLPSMSIKLASNWTLASQRLEDARSYREEAFTYEALCKTKIAELSSIRQYTEQIKELFNEEWKLLNILNKFIATSTEFDYTKISHRIESLLSTELLDDKGRINTKYTQTIHELKNLIGTNPCKNPLF